MQVTSDAWGYGSSGWLGQTAADAGDRRGQRIAVEVPNDQFIRPINADFELNVPQFSRLDGIFIAQSEDDATAGEIVAV
jgi:hypothetical protein